MNTEEILKDENQLKNVSAEYIASLCTDVDATAKKEETKTTKPTSTWQYIKYGLIAASVVGLGFLGYKALKAGPVDPDEVAGSV